ncbi:hypothetical protein D9M68_559140 [compost metagenome]
MLARGGVGLLAFELEQRFLRLDVLLLDLHFLVAAQLVGAHMLDRRQLGDLLDALRIEDVVGVELRQRRLLEVVDGRVFEHVAREVVADLADDLVTEAVARLVEVDEVHRLADRLERFGELGREQLFERLVVGGPRTADALRHLQHVVGGLVDAHEELHLDVRADVVAADQAFIARAVDLDGLDRDVHQLGLVDDRVDHAAGEGHLGLGAQRVHDEGVALFDLAIELGEHREQAEDDDGQYDHGEDDGLHFFSRCFKSERTNLGEGCARAEGVSESGVADERTWRSRSRLLRRCLRAPR